MSIDWGLWILTGAAVVLGVLTPLYDFDRRHVFHPTWPAHARFHAAAYALTNVWLGGLSLWALWARPDLRPVVPFLLAGPALLMGFAALIPGVSSYADGERSLAGIPVSLWGTLGYLVLCFAGAVLL